MISLIPKPYLYLGALLVLLAAVAGAYFTGKGHGADGVQLAWEKERSATAAAQLELSQAALAESQRLANQARQEAAKALEEALAASEARQAARTAQAVRQAALEGRTRAGDYVACRMDKETFEALQEQLK